MGDILEDSTDYQLVRDLLGVSGATDVTDTLITSSAYLGYVEAEVKAVITDWSTIVGADDSDTVRLKVGTAAWVAALIAYAKAGESGGFRIGPYSESSAASVWTNRHNDLMMRAEQALSAISTRTFTQPEILVLAGPTRSKTVPSDFEEWLEEIQPRIVDWLEEGGTEDD